MVGAAHGLKEVNFLLESSDPSSLLQPSVESFASSISLQQVQWHHIRDTRYLKTACDIAVPLDLLNTNGMEISKPYWKPL
jgi:hypothetical protein